MSKGGGTTTETQEIDQRTLNSLTDELRGYAVTGLDEAANLYNQGTEGIYQGTRLAGQDALVGQGEESLLGLYGEGGAMSGLTGIGQGSLGSLLGAASAPVSYDTSRSFEGGTADLSSNQAFQDQLANILDESNVAFQRGSVDLFQKGTAAGQYGGSETGEGLGLLGGEINRATQKSISDAALAQQNLDLKQRQLQQRDRELAQSDIGLGRLATELGYDTSLGALDRLSGFGSQLEREGALQSVIGQDRSTRAQQELENQIQQFDAPRMAELANLSQFYQMMAANPLSAESIGQTTGTTTATTQQPKSDPFSQLLGLGLTIGGMPTEGGGSLLGDFLGGGKSTTSANRLAQNERDLAAVFNN
jgi:hypothetical protein